MIGMPGPIELVIIAVILGAPVVVILILLGMAKGKPTTPEAGPACTQCGGWTVPQANYCQWCGRPLAAGSAPPANRPH